MPPSTPLASLLLTAPRLSGIDLAIVAAYLVGITIFGLRFSRRNKRESTAGKSSLKSYFLAGNTIPWWAIALSIVSAETSTLTIISIPGVAFAGNLGFLQVVLGYMLGRVVVALLFLPRYFRGEMLTAYQLIDQRFGPTLHKLTAGLFLLTRAAAEGVRVFAISIVIGIAIGTNDILSIAIISALTLAYTFEGGLAAVIWTDVVQMALYVAGTIVALITLGHAVPGGWAHIHAVAAPLGKFAWLDFGFSLTKSYTFWAGIFGGTFLTMASHGTDQLMVQRMLAARNLRGARTALLGSGVVIFVQFALFLVIGVGLFVFYNGDLHAFTSADRIFPTFIVAQMPRGIAGLLIAAILAAAMSNLSAALNSLASTTVVDFYLPLKHSLTTKPRHLERSAAESKDPEALHPTTTARALLTTDPGAPSFAPSAKGGVSSAARPLSPEPAQPPRELISRLATVFWAVVLFAIAVYSIAAGGKGHVVETGLSIASVAYGCLLGVFLLGTLTRYASETGAILGMIFGLAVNLTLWLTPANSGWTYTTPTVTRYIEIPHIAFTWYVLIGAVATFVVGSLASLIFRRRIIAPAALAVLFTLCTTTLQAAPVKAAAIDVRSIPRGLKARPKTAWGNAPGLITHPTRGLKARPKLAQDGKPDPTPRYDFTPVSTLITSAIAAHKLPGAVVVIGHNGHIVFRHAYGNRALEPKVEPMTEDTIFDMASLTKVLVTTTAVLQLYEQHKLDLDLPVAHYLPEFATANSPSIIVTPKGQRPATLQPGAQAPGNTPTPSPSAEGATQTTPLTPQQLAWKSRITIRDLLTHYSGLPEDVNLKDDWGLAKPDKAEGIRRAMAAIPYGPPGTTFKYSDINFITLGYLVEKLSGLSEDAYADDDIFKQLRLKDTRYLPIDEACGAGLSVPNYSSGKGSLAERQAFIAECQVPPGARPLWNATSIVPRTAPTEHDDESKLDPASNPFYDTLLRGTVHDPTTRRMGGVAGHAGVFSTAADTATFAQAVLDKLLSNTGPFPLTQATLRLATSPNEPATAATNATIFTQDGQPTKGVASRGLGWDLNSPFSRPRGTIFPITTAGHPGSFGHTGFTGTSLWIDPTTDTYVILLSNAIHPRGAPPISALRGEVATAAAKALRLPQQVSCKDQLCSILIMDPKELGVTPKHFDRIQGATSLPSNVRTGIDVLERTNFAALTTLAAAHGNHLRLGLLTNQTGLDSTGHRTVDLLAHAAPSLELKTIFTPEHGLFGKQDTEHLTAETDAATHIPVISLYGPRPADKRPKPDDLRDLDAIVVDLQDAGARFYTYETIVGYFLEACAHQHIPLIILDRPNPLGGLAVQGPSIDPGRESYTAFTPIPVRHGLTLGELARFFNTYASESTATPTSPDPESIHFGPDIPGQTGNSNRPPATAPGLGANLIVVPMEGWHRGEYFDQTGLPFTPPSPNLRTPAAEITYPALSLTETTNISVGRGSASPFEQLGAPWLDAKALKTYLDARNIPGIQFTATTMTIAEDADHYPSHGQTIPALHLTVTDRTAFDSPECGLELLAALHHLYPTQFKLDGAKTLLANASVLKALNAGEDPRSIRDTYASTLRTFRDQRTAILLYH